MNQNPSSGPMPRAPVITEQERVLVPLALKPGDKEAIRHAVCVAKDMHAEIVLLRVITPFYLINSGMIPMVWPIRYSDERDYEDAKSYIMKLADILIPKDQPWGFRVAEGNAFDIIIRESKHLHAALIVIPPENPHTFASRWKIGGLQRRLQRDSACKVEVANWSAIDGPCSS